jgi:methylenetetrahydrofolate dehydrogenase (NADP+)/methenyltetrahydrofolate cyclohydrolase
MAARVIDGRAFAAGLRQGVAAGVAALKASHGLTPGLAVVLVGDDPASQVYVRNKGIQTREAGMASDEIRLPATTSQAELLQVVARLNADPTVHGILVQMPLPKQIDPDVIVRAIAPAKDVDGLHPTNAGLVALGQPGGLVACTPQGSLMLIKDVLGEDIAGADALVIGRSILVGRPMASLLVRESCTVTVAHSRTRDLPALCRHADIVVAAVGRAEMVRGDWIKPGATVIDVGMNRIALPDGKARLVGDVAYAEASAVAGAITPVPGGVGPMTIACLLNNTLLAAKASAGAG